MLPLKLKQSGNMWNEMIGTEPVELDSVKPLKTIINLNYI
jgi:hypothetical protein